MAHAALAKAEAGDMEAAEAELVAYYSPDTVKIHLQWMIGVKAFRPRMELAQKALRDYSEGRYYSTVLVILSLIDGLVNDLSTNQRGFSAQDVDLHAWNCIVGHETGLSELARIFNIGRRTTRIETIDIPYRHGIIHGMDLGYDNKIVASKVWAALFALREWALKAEQKDLVPPMPEPEPEPTFQEVIRGLATIAASKKRLDAWQPRQLIPGVNLPASGLSEEYDLGSPERTLVEFLQHWRRKNYGGMASLLCHRDKMFRPKDLPRSVRVYYETRLLQSYAITEIVADQPGFSFIEVNLHYIEKGVDVQQTTKVPLQYENKQGNLCPRWEVGGRWALLEKYI